MAEAKKNLKTKKAKEEINKADSKNEAESVVEETMVLADDEKLAKAGKRSSKALKEVEEKQAKQERKTIKGEEPAAKKVQKPARSREERAGKKYREAAKLVEKGKVYSIAEAADLAIKTSPVKFDATIELHINLEVDPKQADQNIRGTIVLPAGTGKSIKIAVLADAEDAKKATAAGADSVGTDNLFAEFDKEITDFDVLITTPTMMPKLAKYARLLGPKGLMPNPKSGTVSADLAKAVTDAKAGRVEFRVDQAGIVHLGVGKASFGPEKLQQNLEAIMGSVKAAKPASVKGIFIKSAYVSSTMGPAVKIET